MSHEIKRKREEVSASSKRRVRFFDGERDIKKHRIDSMEKIIDFINFMIYEKLSTETEISKNLDMIVNAFPENLHDEFRGKIADSDDMFKSNKFFPISFKFKDGDAHLVQLKINDCLSYCQKLWNKAKEKGKLKGYTKQHLGTLMGALESLQYMIDPFRNELTSVSSDETHLLKTCMSIYTNASKLRALDEEINEKIQKTPQQSLEDVIFALDENDRFALIQDFLQKFFEAKWVLNMADEDVQKILAIILSEESGFQITLKPSMLLELWLRLNYEERQDFMAYIKKHLTGKERSIIMGGKDGD